MALGQLHYMISLEKTSSDKTHQSFPLLALVDFLLFHVLSGWARITRRLLSVFLCFLHSRFAAKTQQDQKIQKQLNPADNLLSLHEPTGSVQEAERLHLRREEVETVMQSLGLFSSRSTDARPEDKFGFEEFSRLFEEEPSLEEVKAAFDVFDGNGDGFIDAMELQRVMGVLRLKEGLELENCRRMIRTFDENCDGRLDFSEFLKFMEKSLC